MHRSFGGTAFEPVDEGRDREVTIGPMMLAVLGLVLLALCSLCFIGGYAVGRGGQQTASVAPAASGRSAADLLRESKPAASDANAQPAAADATAPAAPDADSASTAADSTAPAANAAPTATAVPATVKTALPAQGAGAQPGMPGNVVQAALPQAGAWMVQIAAVSHAEDADVLVTALRQRGYAVATRHDPTDGLIHVQVGPFSTHNDAAAMRQRLLNDGYNAVIQP